MKKILFIALTAIAVLTTVSCEKHEHVYSKHDGVEPTFVEAGYKEYYECVGEVLPCGNYFEDAEGAVLIGDAVALAAWCSEGGAGYLPVLTKLSYAGEEYAIAIMKDGNVWMAENLRYVPEGKSIQPLADSYTPGEGDGIFYPAALSIVDGKGVATPSDDAEVIKAQGLLYTAAAIGIKFPAEDFVDAESTQGICPDGWHIPTAQEWINLVGACAAKTYNNPEAPYYVESLSGASLEALNEDGFNFLHYPYLNNGKTYLSTYSNKREDSIYNQMGAMAYFHSSTGRSATQSYAGMITNNNTKSSVNCAYNNLTNAVAVRCVLNK